jgi:hypothetical protein
LKQALSEGLVVGIGMAVYGWIFTLKGPLAEQDAMIYPGTGFYGYHWVSLAGYSDTLQGFIFKNSWGNDWGDDGYGLLPYREVRHVFESWAFRGFKSWYTPQPIDLTGVTAQVFRLYRAAFQRPCDYPGLEYHVNNITVNGLTLLDVATQFLASPEFEEKHGGLDNGGFIYLMYQQVLNREPSNDEVMWYAVRLNDGSMTRPMVLQGFSESPENKELTGTT